MKLLKNEAISTYPELILFLISELTVSSVSITNMISHNFHLQYYSWINKKEEHTTSTQLLKSFALLLETYCPSISFLTFKTFEITKDI